MQTPVRGAAIVIGGAVAKGAFAAGALGAVVEKLARDGTPIRALLGTSSGALNATVLAAGVRAGAPTAATSALAKLWADDAGVLDVLSLDVASLLHGRGLSRLTRVAARLEEACAAFAPAPAPHPIALRLVVAPLAGDRGATTSFEAVERFADADLDTPARRARIVQAATASAAFPYAFEPVEVDPLGPCVDGGIVDNTPVKSAIEGAFEVDAVYVILAEPADLSLGPAEAARLGGVSLGIRLIEMLVHERLVRDLAEAREVNRWIDRLDALVAEGVLTREASARVVEALYGRPVRKLDIVEIRPPARLEGNPFSGFARRDLRLAYLRAGREAAARAGFPEVPAAAPPSGEVT